MLGGCSSRVHRNRISAQRESCFPGLFGRDRKNIDHYDMDRFPDSDSDPSNRRGSVPNIPPTTPQLSWDQGVTPDRRTSLASDVATRQSTEQYLDELQHQLQAMRVSRNTNIFAPLHQETVGSRLKSPQSYDGVTPNAVPPRTRQGQNRFGGTASQHQFDASALTRAQVVVPQAAQSRQDIVRNLNAAPQNLTNLSPRTVIEMPTSRIFKSGNEQIWICAACNGFHPMESCLEFLRQTAGDRERILARKGVCFRCLRTDHQVGSCTSNMFCRVRGCGEFHHGLVHDLIHPSDHFKMHPFRQEIVPVLVRHRNSSVVVPTHAHLSPLITNAVCSTRLIKKLHLSAFRQSRNSKVFRDYEADRCVTLSVQGVNMVKRYPIQKVRLARRLFEVNEHILDSKTAAFYSRTFDIELPALENKDLDLMIGFQVLGLSWDGGIKSVPNDACEYHLPQKRLSLFGWSLLGPDSRLDREPELPSSNRPCH